MKMIAAALACFSLTSCTYADLEPIMFERAAPRTDAETEFAKQTLDRLQILSFNKNREYCGYIGLAPDDSYAASKPNRGGRASCLPKDVDEDFRILASYHTHAAFSLDYNSEFPSSDDLYLEPEDAADGYVSTPGGRIWFTDAKTGTAELVCGEHCVTADPIFDPKDTLVLKQKYTLQELIALEE